METKKYLQDYFTAVSWAANSDDLIIVDGVPYVFEISLNPETPEDESLSVVVNGVRYIIKQ